MKNSKSLIYILQILYEQLELDKKIPSLKMLKTFVGKQKSTSESILKQLVPIHQLPAVVLEYRQVSFLCKLLASLI